mgnify:FL=1
MSTRALIGVVQDDQTIKSVYHHFDGYPDWLGVVLQEKYNSLEKANDLISGGDMSSCYTQSRWLDNGGQMKVPAYGPQYYTGRGEKLNITISDNFKEFTELDCGNEYNYLFKDGKWHGYAIYKKRDDDFNIIEASAIAVSIPQGAAV